MLAVAATAGKDARLRRGERFVRADYRRVFAEGKSFPSRSFVGWLLSSTDAPPSSQCPHASASTNEDANPKTRRPKVGVVVSRRTFPLAVQRNRARRLLREAFRLSKLCVKNDLCILLVGRHHLVEQNVSSRDIVNEFRRFCKKAGIFADGLERSEHEKQ